MISSSILYVPELQTGVWITSLSSVAQSQATQCTPLSLSIQELYFLLLVQEVPVPVNRQRLHALVMYDYLFGICGPCWSQWPERRRKPRYHQGETRTSKVALRDLGISSPWAQSSVSTRTCKPFHNHFYYSTNFLNHRAEVAHLTSGISGNSYKRYPSQATALNAYERAWERGSVKRVN